MYSLNKSSQKYLRPKMRSAETPRRFTYNSVGHLRAAFLFNLLKIIRYGFSTIQRRFHCKAG